MPAHYRFTVCPANHFHLLQDEDKNKEGGSPQGENSVDGSTPTTDAAQMPVAVVPPKRPGGPVVENQRHPPPRNAGPPPGRRGPNRNKQTASTLRDDPSGMSPLSRGDARNRRLGGRGDRRRNDDPSRSRSRSRSHASSRSTRR